MAVRVSQAVIEALWERPSTSPSSPDTGNVAVSHAVIEALMLPAMSVRVSHAVLTALMSPSDAVDTPPEPCEPGGGGGGVRTFGYAG